MRLIFNIRMIFSCLIILQLKRVKLYTWHLFYSIYRIQRANVI